MAPINGENGPDAAAPITFLLTEKFDAEDPTSWFQQFEAKLRIAHIADDAQYDHLLAVLNKAAKEPVTFELQNPPEENQYNWLKQLLIEGHGKSRKQRVQQLLEGTRIGDRKPSVFLAHLRELAPDTVQDDLVKEIWWKELPETVRTVLSCMGTVTLRELATAADAVHAEVYKRSTISAVSSRGRSPSRREVSNSNHRRESRSPSRPPTSSTEEKLLTMISELQKKVDALTSDRSRSRDRSHSRGHFRGSSGNRGPPQHRGRSNSRHRQPQEPGVCWYHSQFRENARKCELPCKFAKN